MFVSWRGKGRREKTSKIEASSIIIVRFVRISIIWVCLQVVNIPSGLRFNIPSHTQEMIFIFAKLKHWFSGFKKKCNHKKILWSSRSSGIFAWFFFPWSTLFFSYLINMAYAEYFKTLTCYSDISSKDTLKSNVVEAFHLWPHLFLMPFAVTQLVNLSSVQCYFCIRGFYYKWFISMQVE